MRLLVYNALFRKTLKIASRILDPKNNNVQVNGHV